MHTDSTLYTNHTHCSYCPSLPILQTEFYERLSPCLRLLRLLSAQSSLQALPARSAVPKHACTTSCALSYTQHASTHDTLYLCLQACTRRVLLASCCSGRCSGGLLLELISDFLCMQAWLMFFFPLHFFFHFLYYTDVGSVTFVVAAYLVSSTSSNLLPEILHNCCTIPLQHVPYSICHSFCHFDLADSAILWPRCTLQLLPSCRQLYHEASLNFTVHSYCPHLLRTITQICTTCYWEDITVQP